MIDGIQRQQKYWHGNYQIHEGMREMEEHELITYEILCVILLLIALALVLAS